MSFTVANSQATLPGSVNANGLVGGNYISFESKWAGFLRSSDGQIVTFAIGPGNTFFADLNNKSWVLGSYGDSSGVNHGFVRRPDGTISSFDDPDAGHDISEGTQPSAINNLRYVTGYYYDSNRRYHGFLVHLR